MVKKSMIIEFGTGADIRGSDYTKAAVRAVNNALRHNSIRFADVFDLPREAMRVTILIGVAEPDRVDRDRIAALLPYGQADVRVEHGGLDIPREDGSDATIMANAALTVYLDLAADTPDGGS